MPTVRRITCAVGNGGPTEVLFHTDGEHDCANYLDEILPYTVDWLLRYLEHKD